MLKYIVRKIPPSNNTNQGKKGEINWNYSRIKKEWEQLIRYTCRPAPAVPIAHARLTLHYYFPDNIRRDPDNYSGKMILDGLVRAGIIKDDSFACIDLVLRAAKDKADPRVEIIIEEDICTTKQS